MKNWKSGRTDPSLASSAIPWYDVHMKNTDKNIKILMMDFSGIYEDQQFWRGKEVSRVEARDIPGTNCYCDEDAMNAIRSRIAPYSSGGIHFIDSGNYHYMTRIWLEKISEPFSLLVFDNHTDMQPPAFGGLLSCGGWIYDSVMELPLLKRVILIGPDEEAFSRVESEIQEKVEFLSREKLLEMEEAQVCAFVSKHVGKLPLYISVDKDVLCKDDADTNWSQGDMRLNTMLECLKRVREICAEGILGVDICGECDVAESGNSALNDRANATLLECFLSAYGSEDHDGNKNEITGGNR